jgi:hypothetical protein
MDGGGDSRQLGSRINSGITTTDDHHRLSLIEAAIA